MPKIRLIRHAPGAPGLRLLGLGPRWHLCHGLQQLQKLLNLHTFWAEGRSLHQIQYMLGKSSVVVTLWADSDLIGFGRAHSDGAYRAVLWDVVVAETQQKRGYGRQIVEALLSSPQIKRVEKVYLMTSRSRKFYETIGFKAVEGQTLMMKV